MKKIAEWSNDIVDRFCESYNEKSQLKKQSPRGVL